MIYRPPYIGIGYIGVIFLLSVVVVVVTLYCHLVTSTSEISHQPAHT